ncbi:MAG: type I restriction enzyme, S subunit [Verrucomicrobia bacterium]|jgi:type I restriction enzyme S subunit|nr:MAG: type I restriction enzyme, S subunit [Verrucomicrobiota bacterium]
MPAKPKAAAALFPDHFQDSELGQIPKGWAVRPFPEAVEVNPRRILKSGVIAPCLDMKNLPTRGHSADEVVGREFTSGTKFQNGDTLLPKLLSGDVQVAEFETVLEAM